MSGYEYGRPRNVQLFTPASEKALAEQAAVHRLMGIESHDPRLHLVSEELRDRMMVEVTTAIEGTTGRENTPPADQQLTDDERTLIERVQQLCGRPGHLCLGFIKLVGCYFLNEGELKEVLDEGVCRSAIIKNPNGQTIFSIMDERGSHPGSR